MATNTEQDINPSFLMTDAQKQGKKKSTDLPENDLPSMEGIDLASDLLKTQMEMKREDAATDNKKWQYVHMCPRGHPALFYRDRPLGRNIASSDWVAKYKPTFEELWQGDVLCQECSKFDDDGEPIDLFPIKAESYESHSRRKLGTRFVPDPDFVYRYPKDKSKLREIPLHRAELSANSSANYGVPNPDFPERARFGMAQEKADARRMNRG